MLILRIMEVEREDVNWSLNCKYASTILFLILSSIFLLTFSFSFSVTISLFLSLTLCFFSWTKFLSLCLFPLASCESSSRYVQHFEEMYKINSLNTSTTLLYRAMGKFTGETFEMVTSTLLYTLVLEFNLFSVFLNNKYVKLINLEDCWLSHYNQLTTD